MEDAFRKTTWSQSRTCTSYQSRDRLVTQQ